MVATGEHQAEGVHAEGSAAIALRGEQEARVGLRRGGPDEERPALGEIALERRPGIGMEGHQEGLAALAPPEAQQRALGIDIVEPQQPHGAVAGGRGDEDGDDGPVA